MIDYFALALGHFLLAIALLRLVQREALDVDPAISAAQAAADAKRSTSKSKSRRRSDDRTQSDEGVESGGDLL